MWCAIDGFPDFEINEFGVVRNKKIKYVTAQRMNRGGYLYVQLSANGKNHVRLVHRLVAETFISNPDMLPIVNHIDECCVHNSVDNLEWVSYKENSNHGTRNERIIRNRVDPVDAYDDKGSLVAHFESKHEAARQLGVTEAAVRASIKRHCRCKGLYFKLSDSQKNNKDDCHDIE